MYTRVVQVGLSVAARGWVSRGSKGGRQPVEGGVGMSGVPRPSPHSPRPRRRPLPQACVLAFSIVGSLAFLYFAAAPYYRTTMAEPRKVAEVRAGARWAGACPPPRESAAVAPGTAPATPDTPCPPLPLSPPPWAAHLLHPLRQRGLAHGQRRGARRRRRRLGPGPHQQQELRRGNLVRRLSQRPQRGAAARPAACDGDAT